MCIALLGACAGDISPVGAGTEPGFGDANDLPPIGQRGGPQIQITQAPAGFVSGVVSANADTWIYLDLDTQTQVFPADPSQSDDWDMAFNATAIALNGGASGSPNGQEVVVYGDKEPEGSTYPWEEITQAPPPGAVDYVSDQSSGGLLGNLIPGLPPLLGGGDVDYAMTRVPAADQEPDPATGAGDYGWYRDSGIASGNMITARPNVAFIVRSVECRYYKLRMTGYTDAAGNPGFPSFDLDQIAGRDCSSEVAEGAPAPQGRAEFAAAGDGQSQRVTVQATDEQLWVYLDLTNGVQVQPDTADSNWDLALRRTDIKLNGGSSGPRNVGIHDMLREDYTALAGVPADANFHQDSESGLAMLTQPPAENTGRAACGGIDSDFGWYYYSAFCDEGNGTHHISARDVVYVLRGRDGNHYKLQMREYYDQNGTAGYPQFVYAAVSGRGL
jgi:hypothetical protein